jgi:hypothetical protein
MVFAETVYIECNILCNYRVNSLSPDYQTFFYFPSCKLDYDYDRVKSNLHQACFQRNLKCHLRIHFLFKRPDHPQSTLYPSRPRRTNFMSCYYVDEGTRILEKED